MSTRRTSVAPDVPTISEQGFGDFDLVAWFMLYAPAATPAPVLAKLREAVVQAVSNPEVKAKLAADRATHKSTSGGSREGIRSQQM